MTAKKRGLGKGLDALFSDNIVNTEMPDEQIVKPAAETDKKEKSGEIMMKISDIVPNQNQPRKNFDKADLEELTASIKEYGVVSPLIVKKSGDFYEIIAGERRWRAAQAAGLKELPVIVREYDEQLADEIALIENLQRADLNPIEEAQAYQKLMEDYSLSQEELAVKVSKSRTTVTNMLRLLKLDARVQAMMIDGSITGGHARALLSLESGDAQKAVADLIVEKKLSVRDVEKKVKALSRGPKKAKPAAEEKTIDDSIFYKEYEDKLKDILGTKVNINRKDKNKGKVEIEYYSQPELERIIELLEGIK